MSFRGMIFGDPERRRRKKQQEDLDRDYYNRRKAYLQAKEEQRKKNAVQQGIVDANKLANQKPFYQKVVGAVTWLGKDLVDGSAKVKPDVFFTWEDNEAPQSRKKRKRRRKRD